MVIFNFSDLCAGLIGGLGVTPSGNIGREGAIFESVSSYIKYRKSLLLLLNLHTEETLLKFFIIKMRMMFWDRHCCNLFSEITKSFEKRIKIGRPPTTTENSRT